MTPEKFTKNEVKYTDDHGESSEQCSKCRHFVETTRGNSCAIVWGAIKAGGWCNRFKRK